MSRAIQIRVSESLTRTVHVEDGVEAPLELLPILPPERMGELLAAELVARGFTREARRVIRIEADGTAITVDLDTSRVGVRLAAEAPIEETTEQERSVAVEHRERQEAALRQEALRDLDARVAARTEALRRGVTTQLERKLGDVRAELDGAVGRATIAALTERAGQLGQIESVVGDEAGNVTIRVKL